MARLSAVDPGAVKGKTKDQLARIHSALGMTPNMMRTMAQSPALLDGYLGFSQALGGGALPATLRQQIALAVGEANRCVYCLSAHTAIGRQVGLGAGEMEAARRASSSDSRTDAALKFARLLVEKRGDVSDDDVDRLKAAGFSQGEIAEVIGHVALNIFTNYFNKAADVDVDFPRVELEQGAAAAIR
ncbi:MAG TPA: carboxymuconolactone decarboxylase family protein [Candidatus Methylomirabilis sp.]|nr:carboxymuconolactone decarboxylase family protein [Candidatus Methylomirabilis sp.]